jgi:hypothetical protein
MLKSRYLLIGVVVLFGVLILGVGLGRAQEPSPTGEQIAAPEAVDSSSPYIPIQGRLADASGNPLNGTYTMKFSLYSTSTGGTALCVITRSVSVTNGLFNSTIVGCEQIDGRSLYLGIQVGTDAEMTPRQMIDNVAYAWSLHPGAMISGTISGSPILEVQNWGQSGRGLRSYAMAETGENFGIVGASRSVDGYGGYFYNNAGGLSLWGFSTGNQHPSIYGCTSTSSDNCTVITNPAGLMGYSTVGDGISATATNGTFRGLFAQNTGTGIAIAAYNNVAADTNHTRPTLYLQQGNTDGDFVVGVASYLGTRYWRVDRSGRGFFNGGTQASGADFAEQVAAAGSPDDYEPGDVLVISTQADRLVELSARAFSTAVMGVFSTQPAMLAGAPDTNDPLGGLPVAVVGIVPCKVSAENGPIGRGDLLVTAALPGHAMRAGDNPPQGTVLGKALQPLEKGTGIILILVALQ